MLDNERHRVPVVNQVDQEGEVRVLRGRVQQGGLPGELGFLFSVHVALDDQAVVNVDVRVLEGGFTSEETYTEETARVHFSGSLAPGEYEALWGHLLNPCIKH